jgi:undecaprenyl-diphosphatase
MLNFLQTLQTIDVKIFFLINNTLKNNFFDFIMPFITTTKNFYIIFLLIFLYLIIFGKFRGKVAAISIVVGVTISDLLCSKILKHLINRPRPFMIMDEVIKMVSAAGPSMPSSHAMNSFTVATMFLLFFKKNGCNEKNWFIKIIKSYWVGIIAYFFAFLSSYSRVYVGVHYPSDVLLGAILGIFLGIILYKIFKKVYKLSN